MSDYDLPDLPSDEDLGIAEDEPEAHPHHREATHPSGPPPLGGARGPVTLLVLLLVCLVSSQWWALPSPVPANAPDTVFSSARAMAQLVEIASVPHPTGSPEHARVRAYLLDELRDLGIQPTVQTTTSIVRAGDGVRAATVRNIVARLPGTSSTGALLLTAHYDSRELSPGAGDDGMGVVTLLETLRALRRGPPLKNDLIVLFSDGEELGLMGARAFVRASRWMDEIAVALSLEMRGGGGAALMFETGRANGWIIPRFGAAAPSPVANSIMEEIYERMPNDTDLTPLKDAGVQGLGFAGIGRAHLYHQASDLPQNVSEATLQHYGNQILPLVRLLGSEDLTEVEAPDLTYVSLPFVGLVSYGSLVTWGLSALLLLLWAALVWAGRRRESLAWGGVAAGAGLLGVVSLAGWGIGAWLVGWLSGFHPEHGALAGSAFHSEGWYVLALAAAVFTLLIAGLAALRRRFGLASLVLGATALPVLGAVALTLLAPMAAPNLQWPALTALLASLLVLGVPPRGRQGVAAWVGTLLLALPVLGLLAGLTELIWLGLSIAFAPGLAVLVAVVLALLLPTLDTLREPNSWWAPAVGLLATLVFLGVGILTSGASAERPLPSTLVYTLDRESGEAHWLTQPEFDAGDTTATDPEPDAARAWARTQVDAAFDSSLTLPWMFAGAAPSYPAAPARVVDVPEPQISVVSDTVVGATRTVRLGLRSELGAEMLVVALPPSDQAVLQAVDGQSLPAEGVDGRPVATPTQLTHWGTPQGVVLLEFGVGPGISRLSLGLVEHLLRPEEILGRTPWRRPPTLAPNVVRGSDRAVIRTPLDVVLTGAAPPSSDTLGVAPDEDR